MNNLTHTRSMRALRSRQIIFTLSSLVLIFAKPALAQTVANAGASELTGTWNVVQRTCLSAATPKKLDAEIGSLTFTADSMTLTAPVMAVCTIAIGPVPVKIQPGRISPLSKVTHSVITCDGKSINADSTESEALEIPEMTYVLAGDALTITSAPETETDQGCAVGDSEVLTLTRAK